MKYFKQFSTYTLIGFFGAGISFLLMPYLSHFLEPEEYGILSMINSLVTIFIPFIGLTAAGIINVEYYKEENKKEFASLFSSVQAVPVIPFLFFLAIAFLLRQPIAQFLEIPINKAYWIPLSCLIALLTIYTETLTSYNVTEQKPGYYALFSILRVIIEVSLTVFFIASLGYSWEGRLLAWLIASVAMFIVSFIYFKKRDLLTFRLRRSFMRISILFGLPLILHVVGKFVINQSDRIFITRMVSLEEAGIYNIGYQVGTIMLIVVGAAGNFIQPFLYERLANLTKEAKSQIVKLSYGVIAAFFVVLLAITLATPTFFTWFINESYARGTVYVFWVGLSYFFWGVYLVFSSYIFYSGKTKILGWLALVNVVFNLVFNYFLIQLYGSLGAAYATCLSYFIVCVVIVYMANRLYPLPWLGEKLRAKNI